MPRFQLSLHSSRHSGRKAWPSSQDGEIAAESQGYETWWRKKGSNRLSNKTPLKKPVIFLVDDVGTARREMPSTFGRGKSIETGGFHGQEDPRPTFVRGVIKLQRKAAKVHTWPATLFKRPARTTAILPRLRKLHCCGGPSRRRRYFAPELCELVPSGSGPSIMDIADEEKLTSRVFRDPRQPKIIQVLTDS